MSEYEFMAARVEELARKIELLEARLQKEYIGDLRVIKDRNHYRWRLCQIQSDGKKKTITLSQKNRHIAEKAARITLERARLQDYKKEYKACISYINSFRNMDGTVPKNPIPKAMTLLGNPGFLELINASVSQREQEMNEWELEEYDNGKTYYPNQLNVTVTKNLTVRSKTERTIAIELKNAGLHFRYEWRQNIGGDMIPDFTIIHPRNGLFYYWEHHGMIDLESYQIPFLNKLRRYLNAGIYPDDRLILTFETQDHPLDIQIVKEKIRTVFFT
ncbi:MAG: hypothetical protein IJM83_05925 [Firmicutes bacterium]|nr:hypothetical protein [Bacillota bacterium]